ncbi:MAG: LLM class flavin-dependent oxidoreductase [Acidimicrobiia bacterium]|nr:LLM class flavin-dependent oxidoreductase [Acidimicrobiia bacterium]
MKRKYGLLLPHFGPHASRDALVGMAAKIEDYGFDSVWVRDHIIFHPHGFEDPDRTHVEPFVVLSAIAAVTEQLILGFGSLIPHRHPIYAALSLGSLEWLAGPGRIIAGFGMGTYDHEFDALGLGEPDRRELLPEHIEIMRTLWSGEEVSYKGKFYSFEDVDVHPEPSGGEVPVWYCGGSAAAVRRTIEWRLQGWMPGRINFASFEKRIDRLKKLMEEHGVEQMPEVSAIPITSPGRTFEDGVSKVDAEGMLESARKRKWLPGASGGFETPRDLEGALIAGTADDIIESVEAYHERGLAHLVFDLRNRFDEWEELVASLAEDVLPEVRRG